MRHGNPVILKHASNVPGCAIAIEEIFRDAGHPPGMFTSLLIDSARAGDLIDDRRITAVTLTGSVVAGRAIAARAGRALKKTVLELGGSDTYGILEDADLNGASKACTTARLINNGQSCIEGTRDVARDEKIASERLEAGSCFVNTFVRSDPRLPFGGIKDSGYGRELSEFGIREFVNVKTVCLKA